MKTDGRHVSLIQERISALHLADIFLFCALSSKLFRHFRHICFLNSNHPKSYIIIFIGGLFDGADNAMG